jgi:uncharacterized membrane protein
MFAELLHGLGFGLCHQLPERSFAFGGLQWPVCARCSGIYLGLVCALIALLLAYRGRQRGGGPAWPFWPFLALALAAMAYDGFSSYLGWRPTTNLLRLLTGVAVGAALAVLLYSMLAETLARHVVRGREGRVLGGGVRPVLYFTGSMLASVAAVYLAGPVLGPLMAGLDALAIVATFGLLVLVLIGLVRRFEGSISGWRDLLLPGALALAGGTLIIVGAGLLKALILS